MQINYKYLPDPSANVSSRSLEGFLDPDPSRSLDPGLFNFKAAVAAIVARTSPSEALLPRLAVGGTFNVSFCSILSNLSDDLSTVEFLEGIDSNFSSSFDLEPLLCDVDDKLRWAIGLVLDGKDAPVSILPLLTLEGLGTPNKLLILELAGFTERKSGKCA